MSVAVDRKARKEKAVVGRVEWEKDRMLPIAVLNQIKTRRRDAVVAYISEVNVTRSWQNQRVGSAMLPKALGDIRARIPDVMAAYLFVTDTNTWAIRLYTKFNFTCIRCYPYSRLCLYSHILGN
ncbi:hypothetical protein FOZ60_016434 [Perkinsus olseni]|nr:hypothetical protein FOZ60_016434 [Perkinsus olseni]